MVESAVAQKNKSPEALVPWNACHQLSHNPIQLHTTELWHILSKKDTALTYQQAGAQTWALLAQIFQLFFFLLKSLAALSIWFCGIGFRSGWHFRQWLEVERPSLEEVIALCFKVVLWPLEHAFQWSEQFVKKYFGWEFKSNPDVAKD